MKDLSIIILSYNTKDITLECINSVVKSIDDKLACEIIVVDNNSSDDTVKSLKTLQSQFSIIRIIENKENLGFAKANNQGAKEAKSKYLLFLNSDVIVDNVSFPELINHLDSHSQVGVLTVKLNLNTKGIDLASHRGFPTLWRSFCYFSGLEKLLGRNRFLAKIFGGYHLLQFDLNKEHEIDSPSGAFFMVRKNVFDAVKGFDEDYFMYGEDLDLAFRIKKINYKIIYYPEQSATHLKYSSGLKTTDEKIRQNIRDHFYDAMLIFYKKHYEGHYPAIINKLVYFLINVKKKYL
jgi:GT2 family glycosyltransferase